MEFDRPSTKYLFIATGIVMAAIIGYLGFTLYELEKRSDELYKAIERKKKLIKKHKIELKSMLTDYHGREPDYMAFEYDL